MTLDKELYNTLQLVKDHKGSFKPENDEREAQALFDDLVTKLIVLRDQGLIDLTDGRILRNCRGTGRYSAACPKGLLYPGTKVLSYDSFESYQTANQQPSPITITDKSVTISNVSNSAIAAHSVNVDQSVNVNPEISELLSKMEVALRNDIRLTEGQKNDYLTDVVTIRQQLSKQAPNEKVITALLSPLANVASIGAFVAQVTPMLAPLFG